MSELKTPLSKPYGEVIAKANIFEDESGNIQNTIIEIDDYGTYFLAGR